MDTDELSLSGQPSLERLPSLKRPWSQLKNPLGQQCLFAHGFKGSKEGDGRKTKKCLFKLTIYLGKASFISKLT